MVICEIMKDKIVSYNITGALNCYTTYYGL